MDYKKILKSRAVRLAILKMLCFVPDKPMVKLQYRIRTGRKLNLKNPQRYTEKLQWYKLNDRTKAMVPCVDKADVRDYVQQKGLGHILNQCLGVYDRAEQVDFSQFPEKFVLKDTLGGGGNAVILVKDKKQADTEALKKQMASWVSENHKIKSGGREWPYYSGKKHRIIAESYLEDSDTGLTDYKFLCFNGKVEYFFIRSVVPEDHDAGRMAFYDSQKNFLPGVGLDYYTAAEKALPLPKTIETMMEYARILSEDFPHVRVDFYEVGGKIIFGELTFFHASGFLKFSPDEFDFDLGKKFVLPESNI